MYVYVCTYVYSHALNCAFFPSPTNHELCCSRPCAMLLKSVNASQGQAKSAIPLLTKVPVPLKP